VLLDGRLNKLGEGRLGEKMAVALRAVELYLLLGLLDTSFGGLVTRVELKYLVRANGYLYTVLMLNIIDTGNNRKLVYRYGLTRRLLYNYNDLLYNLA
jgi:hypothetical protein